MGSIYRPVAKVEMWGLWTFTGQVDCNEKTPYGLKYEGTQLPR